ncbi:hypothetical protein PFLU3_56930 [Pseudomonas fluorescens]|uniref:Uncharacterized protein n=1 Tax=Pseudomonas fluorescens TaxID=294 RepID=A0A0D0SYX1_PSEFL|nr:hypothetical protein PFLU3_56930 [Pseudomonas fluorescens]
MLLGQQQANAAVLDHIAQAVLRIFRIQRHISATGLEHRQQADNHVQAAFSGDAYQRIRADTQLDQLVRKLVGAPVELGVAEL